MNQNSINTCCTLPVLYFWFLGYGQHWCEVSSSVRCARSWVHAVSSNLIENSEKKLCKIVKNAIELYLFEMTCLQMW